MYYRGYVKVHNLNAIESVIYGDVTNVKELLVREKEEDDVKERERQNKKNNTVPSDKEPSRESQNLENHTSKVISDVHMTMTGSNDVTARKSTRVRTVNKKLLEQFESDGPTKSNMEPILEVQNDENKKNQGEKTVDVTQRVRRDLKILRRLDHCVEHLHKHIERIGELGAVRKCEFMLQSMMMMSLNEKMK